VTRQFAGFLLAGGIAAAANVGSRMAFSLFFDLAVAVVLAYLVGMAVAFVLMRRHVFPLSEAPVARQVAVFCAVNLLAVLQTLVVTLVLARWLLPRLGVSSHVEEIAHVAGVCVPVLTSFLGHKHLSFR
jgi:putative flippase GtrA